MPGAPVFLTPKSIYDTPRMSHYGAQYQSYPPTSNQHQSGRMIPNPVSYATTPSVSAPASTSQHSSALPHHSSFQPPPFYVPPPANLSYSMQPPYAPASQSYSSMHQHNQHQPQQHSVSEAPSAYSYYEHVPNYSTTSSAQMHSHLVLPNHTSPVQTAHSSSHHFLHPSESAKQGTRVSRSTSLTSSGSSMRFAAPPEGFSRSTSPSAAEMANWGYRNEHGTWSCAFAGCSSKSTFQRGCDLRKHYRRHTKTLFCRHAGCPQSTEGGFSSKKDRARHEAKHNPQITCEWPDCDRLFSRLDNMVRMFHKTRVGAILTSTHRRITYAAYTRRTP